MLAREHSTQIGIVLSQMITRNPVRIHTASQNFSEITSAPKSWR